MPVSRTIGPSASGGAGQLIGGGVPPRPAPCPRAPPAWGPAGCCCAAPTNPATTSITVMATSPMGWCNFIDVVLHFSATHEKFAASLGLPLPLYLATSPKGHSGCVLSTWPLV